MRVLVVDDDDAVRRSLARALRRDGLTVEEAAGGLEALDRLSRVRHDAVVLDVLMPEPNGLEVCKRLRRRGDDTPIVMLTARGLVTDRVAGLDAGADDYLIKPFALEELRARVRALLRRSGAARESLVFQDVRLDLAERRATRGGRLLPLTQTEMALLELFLRNPRRVLTREMIYESVWGYDGTGGSTALWVHISYLRGKLEEGGACRLIQTVRGVGYVLRADD